MRLTFMMVYTKDVELLYIIVSSRLPIIDYSVNALWSTDVVHWIRCSFVILLNYIHDVRSTELYKCFHISNLSSSVDRFVMFEFTLTSWRNISYQFSAVCLNCNIHYYTILCNPQYYSRGLIRMRLTYILRSWWVV